MNECADTGAILSRIRQQAAADQLRLTQHAHQEMTEEDFTLCVCGGSASIDRDHGLRAKATKVAHLNAKEAEMKCSIQECPGEYEKRLIVHTVRYHKEVVVFDHVPAEVCSVCCDVLLDVETVRKIENLLEHRVRPVKNIPLYEYA